MRMTKEQAYEAINQLAQVIEKETKCTGREAIEQATKEVDIMVKSFTKGKLTLFDILELGGEIDE